MSSVLNRDEFTAGYLIEADEHLRSAISNLLAVEAALASGAPQHRSVRELFRSLHTLKGLSAMVGVEPIVDLAHEMEAILRNADRHAGKLSAEAVELLLRGVRTIEERITAFANKQRVAPAPRKLLDALIAFQADAQLVEPKVTDTLSLDAELSAKLAAAEREQLASGIAAGRRALRIDFVPSPERSAAGVSITSVRERIGALAEIVKVVPRAVPKSGDAPAGLLFALLVLTEASDEALASAACTDAGSFMPIELQPRAAAELGPEDDELPDDTVQAGKSFIRVEVSRLDDALEKLSSLVVTRFKLVHALNALRDRGVDVRELSSILHENHRQLRDLRGAITRARMVSVSELLERVPLIVRGMQRSTGKHVRLQVDAGRAELDKAVAERVFPALVHLVRNAVDHAIESPSERQKSGKPAEGTISVSCFEHSDTLLEISVSDDGRGIDAAAVAQRAGRRVPQDERELLELITLPGLSTLQAATSNSGRGMGMDIVRRIAVDLLGGELSLRTTPGRGSTFTMRLPMSISILDSFSFVCADQTFAVPISVVDEIVDLESSRIVRTPEPQRGKLAALRLLQRRSEAIPLFSLATLLSLVTSRDEGEKALIVRPRGQAFAFAVDRMLGQQEIVVRPLEDPLVKVAGVAGTTDLGDGRPTLVLDLIGLSVLAARVSGETRASA